MLWCATEKRQLVKWGCLKVAHVWPLGVGSGGNHHAPSYKHEAQTHRSADEGSANAEGLITLGQ